jgi:predicted GIY-YIG superfamily endonuclease
VTTVYLLHFHSPISPDHTTQHYVGIATKTLQERMEAHAKGSGARLTQVALERGIGWTLVRTWPEGSRTLERAIKKARHVPDFCPVCRPGNKAGLSIVKDGQVLWFRQRFCRPRLRYVVLSKGDRRKS